MSKRIKGLNSFRASDQTRGSAASLSKGKGKGKGKERVNETDMDDDLAFTPPLPNTPISVDPSSATTSGSKRKHSALGETSSVGSNKKPSTISVVSTVGDQIGKLSDSIHDMTAERKALREQHEARFNAQAAQVFQNALALPPEQMKIEEAIRHVQETDLKFDMAKLTTIIQVLTNERNAAIAYLACGSAELREAWVEMQLARVAQKDGLF